MEFVSGWQAQQTTGIATQHGTFRFWIEPQCFHLSHRVGKPCRQWIITTNNQMFGTIGVDQVAQHILTKGNSVEGKLINIGRGWAWQGSLAFRIVPIPHIEAAEQAREGPTRMVQDHA